MLKVFPSLTALVLLAAAVTANAAPAPGDARAQLIGRVPELGLSFLVSRGLADSIVVDVSLPSGTVVHADIDYAEEEVALRSLRQDRGGAGAITAADLEAINRLPSPLPATGASALQDVLLGVLNLIASYPPGSQIELSTRGSAVASKAIVSLCASTGQQVTGTYTLHGKMISETVELGPCYNEKNACLGRCGPGCGPPPSATIQRFTQNCLNHDLCTRANGGNIFGDCTGLWFTAAKDFLFAPDCGSLSATWNDNYSLVWDLAQAGGRVRGEVTTPSCRDWLVTGSHAGANVNLTARNPRQIQHCCTAFTYVGKLQDCSNAAGTWTNECGFKGTWTMIRDGSAGKLVTVEEDSPTSGEPPNP